MYVLIRKVLHKNIRNRLNYKRKKLKSMPRTLIASKQWSSPPNPSSLGLIIKKEAEFLKLSNV